MTHPAASPDEPVRRAVDAALAGLEAAGRLTISGARADVVDAICAGLRASGVGQGAVPAERDAGTLAAFLDHAADADAAEWRQHAGAPYASAHVDEARRQAALTHMRLEQGGITREQAATYFASLARALRERDASDDGS